MLGGGAKRRCGPRARPRGWRPALISGLAAATALAITGAGAGAGTALAASSAVAPHAEQAQATPAMPQIVPKPVSMTVGSGQFTVTAGTRIAVVAGSAAAQPVAQDLASYLRPAPGYRLPVAPGPSGPRPITLAPRPHGPRSATPDGEGSPLHPTSPRG